MSAATAEGASNRPAPPSRLRRNAALLVALAAVLWSAVAINVKPAELLDIPAGLWLIFERMFLRGGPDVTYLPTAVQGMIQSIEIAWVGTVIGAILSLPVGFFAAKNVSSGLVSNVVRQFLNAVRAFPEVVLAVAIFIPIAGLGPVAGALAIGVHSIGTLGKLTAEVIEGIDVGPVEAARASGGNALQVQRWGVLPQVLPEIVAFWLYRFEINVRASAILGFVGAGGIGQALQQTLVFGHFAKSGMALIVVIVATIVVDTASGWLRRRIIEGTDRKVAAAEVFESATLPGAAI
jgi:phosphonate transport system permease protein